MVDSNRAENVLTVTVCTDAEPHRQLVTFREPNESDRENNELSLDYNMEKA